MSATNDESLYGNEKWLLEVFREWFVEQFGPEPHTEKSYYDLRLDAEGAEREALDLRSKLAERISWQDRYDACLKAWTARGVKG